MSFTRSALFCASWCFVLAIAAAVQAASVLPDGYKDGGGFTATDVELTALVTAGEARIVSTAPLAPGYYTMTAEFCTDGFDATGGFAVDVKTGDRTANLSGYEWTAAQPAGHWSPVVIYFKVEKQSDVLIRFGNWKKAGEGAKFKVRKVEVKPFNFAAQVNADWLAPENWDAGQAGFVPPAGWYLQDDLGSTEQLSLIKNESFRSGSFVLHMTGDGSKARVLRHHNLPLPPNGEIELSLWAKSADGGKITMHVVLDGWSKRVEKPYAVTDNWKKYTAEFPVPQGSGKNWFFIRLDKDSAATSVDIADVQVRWKPAGPVDTAAPATGAAPPIAPIVAPGASAGDVDPYADAKSRGWQGVPGKNLLYNPDFELGGTGYFYDFSWPKTMGNYQFIRNAKPIEFLEGKGVDGGTCVLVQGASLRAYCFPVTVGHTYTVSADVRAPEGVSNASGSVWVFDSEWNNALASRINDVPSDRWKRYQWTFTWTKDNIQRRGYVRFDSAGLLIDRIQVAEGKLGEYDAPPVMLGLVTNDMQYFVRGRDSAKATIKIVPGKLQDGTANVEVVATDAWGTQVWKQTFDAPLNKVTLRPMDLPTDQLGTVHVNLAAKINGQIAGIGIARYAVVEPAAVQATTLDQPGLAGVCQETFNFPVWLCEDQARVQSDIGIRFNRFFASVPPKMPLPIPEDFAADLLAKCKPFRDAGIDVMPCVELLPREGNEAEGVLRMPTQEELDSFGKYLHAYVTALKSQVRYWEIFNEPNLWRVASGADKGKRTMYPAKYFEYQKVAYKTIKSIDPQLQVVCNALNNIDWDWLDEWMKLGAGEYMDAFSFHPYGVTNFYPDGKRLEKVMAGYDFKGALINSEKYYGANLFFDRCGYEETRRGYYLPYNKEMETAGRSIQLFVSSAAVGVPSCFFNPMQTLYRRGPGRELFVYDFMPAYNAANRFMADAGRAQNIDMGMMITALLFADAKGGPLVAVWSENLELDARMKMNGKFTAYDMMGNAYSAQRMQQGLRIATDPTYIRFAPGTATSVIADALHAAEITGLGSPFRVDVAVTGPHQITAKVTSMRNKPLDGDVKLIKLPEGWAATSMSQSFKALGAGKTVRVNFKVDGISDTGLAEYAVSVLAESGEEFTRSDATVRPIFVKKVDGIKADGDLSDWAGAKWLQLSDANLSKDFNANLKRQGDSDLSAKVAMGWNEAYFAVAVVVTDDVMQPAEAAGLGWQGDALQLYFDQLNDAIAGSAHPSDDVAYSFSLIGGKAYAWLDKGAEGNFKGAANKTDGLNDGDVDVSIKREGNTTTYEIRLPRAKCLPRAELVPDGNLRFTLLINDNDGKGRKVGLTLAPKGSEPYGHAHEYCDLVLIEK